MNSRCVMNAVLVIAVVGFVGCGGVDRPKTVPISGRITINGKPPGENGRLHFAPTEVAAGYSKRPAGGAYDPQGVYRVMSWEPDDGLVPGHYVVSLMPGDPATSAIPVRYRENYTSGLEVDVPVDQGPVEFNIEIPSK